ncbi:hypothetical protein OROGR_003816 [Orobanche gracilis]
MALSPLISKAYNNHHNRSLSLPCPKSSNPAFSHLERTLSDIRASEASCSSLSSTNDTLNGLKNLYFEIGELLQLPHVQHINLQEFDQEKWADQLLDGHINLLDACTTAKDLVSQMKQNIRDLLSALRRKDTDNIRCYLNSRRKLKRTIQKSLKVLRRSFKSKHDSMIINVASLCKDNHGTMDLVCMLKDAETVTVSMLESLLSHLIGANDSNKARQARHKSGWSLVVSKMLVSKKIASHNECEKIDGFFQMSLEVVQANENIMSHLKKTESSIQNIEEELDGLFRQLIKIRVILLNLLNH